MTSLEVAEPGRKTTSLMRHVPALRKAVGLVLLAALAFAFIIPILWMTVMSFQEGGKMFDLRTEWIPAVWHFENYPNAISRAPFVQYFINSGIVSIAVMAGNVVFCTLAGYGLAKFHFRGSGLVLLLILSTLMLPLEVTLVPTFLIVHKFEWINTYQGIVAPLLIDAFGVFLMRQSIISIPSDYIEAARIDGAGELRILLADHRAAMPAGAVGARDLLVPRQLGSVSLAADGGVDRQTADLSARSGSVRRGIRQPGHRADGDRRARDAAGLPSVHDPAEIGQSRIWLERTEIDGIGDAGWPP